MSEINAFMVKEGKQDLIMEFVYIIEPAGDGKLRLVDVFGEEKVVHGRIKRMNLLSHVLILEEDIC